MHFYFIAQQFKISIIFQQLLDCEQLDCYYLIWILNRLTFLDNLSG